jgi:hypothetical protein
LSRVGEGVLNEFAQDEREPQLIISQNTISPTNLFYVASEDGILYRDLISNLAVVGTEYQYSVSNILKKASTFSYRGDSYVMTVVKCKNTKVSS